MRSLRAAVLCVTVLGCKAHAAMLMAEGYIGAMLRPVTGGPMDPYRGPIFYDIPNIPGAEADDTLEDYVPPASLISLECGPYRLAIGFYVDPCKPVPGNLDGGSIQGGYNSPLTVKSLTGLDLSNGPDGSNDGTNEDHPGGPGDPNDPGDSNDPGPNGPNDPGPNGPNDPGPNGPNDPGPNDPNDPGPNDPGPNDPNDPGPNDPNDPDDPLDPNDPVETIYNPEPSTMLLMGAGLAALVFARRKLR